MTTTYAPLVRIVLRYLAGILISLGATDTAGVVSSVLDDQDALLAVTGIIVGAGSELWYAVARRKGGPT